MQAVILTAGRGRRMEPLSLESHKALLQIGDSTILGRALDGLIEAGVNTVTIVTGYRADDITEFVTTGYPTMQVTFIHNGRYEITNNIVSLALALESLIYNEDIIMIECDLLFEPHVLTDLVEQPGGNVALVDHYRTGMSGTVVATDGGFVSQIFLASSQDADFNYRDKFKTLNIYRFDRVFCQKTLRPMLTAYADNVDDNCYYEIVLGMLANIPQHRIAAQVVEESDWVEVDDPNDLAVARFAFEPPERASVLDRSFGGHWSFGILDFSLPRNAYFPPPAMLAALRHALPDVITSYGSTQAVLDEKVALFLGCQPDFVHLLNGASQAYPILGQLYRGKRIAIPAPTFGEYRRCFSDAETYKDSPGIDFSQIEALARNSDVLVLVNPNNPTGTTIPTELIYDLAARTPGTTFLVDESFLAFSGQQSLIKLLSEAPLENMLVLTSLGKPLGIPGLRLGYLYSTNHTFWRAFKEHMPIWGVNALAEFFMELTIKFRSDLDRSIALTVAERSRMQSLLAEFASVSQVYESGANFVLVELLGAEAQIASSLRQALLIKDKIEIKDVSDKFPDRLPRLRIAVRTETENDRLIKALSLVDLPPRS
jgi:histidinol-phosphate/aromatic aminotransferase/cobyric acid decarboxylase-like protein/choline kinase